LTRMKGTTSPYRLGSANWVGISGLARFLSNHKCDISRLHAPNPPPLRAEPEQAPDFASLEPQQSPVSTFLIPLHAPNPPPLRAEPEQAPDFASLEPQQSPVYTFLIPDLFV
jgi:hypothetical protein